MRNNFRTYALAVAFHHQSRNLRISGHLKDQVLRASASVVLNLAEGRGRNTRKDQLRFFHIAMASLRECQAVLDLENLQGSQAWGVLDHLGASLYRLIKNAR